MTYYACPPEWNLTPKEYFNLPHDHRHKNTSSTAKPFDFFAFMVPAGGANVAGWALTCTLLDEKYSGTMLGAFTIMTGYNIFVGVKGWTMYQRDNRRKLIEKLPVGYQDLVVPMSYSKALQVEVDIQAKDCGTRAEILQRVWDEANEEHKRDQARRKLRDEAEAKARAVAAGEKEQAKRIAELEKALAEKIVLDNPLPLVKSTKELLGVAYARHTKVADAWAEIITDPLNALEHASLFDITDTRTAKFVGAFSELQDLRAIYGESIPGNLAESYVEKTREVERLWEDAYTYSTKRGVSFLPAAEQELAKKAMRLLALASDERAMPSERAQAAKKATEVLEKISAVTLPAKSIAQIEKITLLALPSAG